MRIFRAFPGLSRHAGSLTVLLALLLRFAIPTGYMLAGDGSLAIVPCPGAGAVALMPPATHGDMTGMHMAHAGHRAAPIHRDPAQHQDTFCPSAALSAAALPPDPPLLTDRERPPFAELAVPSVRHLALPALAAPPPPSRGPPRLS